METQAIVINFKSNNEVEEQVYQVILKTINEQFVAAKGNLSKMEALNQLAKELRYATEYEIDQIRRGPIAKKYFEPAFEAAL